MCNCNNPYIPVASEILEIIETRSGLSGLRLIPAR